VEPRLEALRALDAPVRDDLDEFHQELAVKRLGMSPTVAAQIDRYRQVAVRDGRIENDEVVALLRLVGRRTDADLVFSDAGRRAGRYAVRRLGLGAMLSARGLPRFARGRLGLAMARRAARVFDATLELDGELIVATIPDPPSAVATPGGSGCGFFGAAVAETLRALTDFDGAMLHIACRARGDSVCRWRTATARGE
jgi:hypothetical protein